MRNLFVCFPTSVRNRFRVLNFHITHGWTLSRVRVPFNSHVCIKHKKSDFWNWDSLVNLFSITIPRGDKQFYSASLRFTFTLNVQFNVRIIFDINVSVHSQAVEWNICFSNFWATRTFSEPLTRTCQLRKKPKRREFRYRFHFEFIWTKPTARPTLPNLHAKLT